ncbi:MAG: lipopolysaccharide biosynthesis protein [bacterium]
MSAFKKLASQTAYYGISSILGRMLNYALVPLHTRVLTSQQDYGIIGELYSYITFLNIIFLYGLETTFFRFATENKSDNSIYNKAFTSILFSSILLAATIFLFATPINNFLSIGITSNLYRIEYLYIFALILAFDAIAAIPFAKIRLDNRPLKFTSIKIANISINVLLNVFFLIIAPIFDFAFYSASDAVLYILISNLIASIATLFFLYQELIIVKLTWIWKEMKPLYVYAIPLMFAGLAGMTNETLDRILLKYFLPGTLEERLSQIGIYNAAYKLSIFMTLAVQAFRMAAEPYFFSINKNADSKIVYAKVMNYFVLACSVIFLGVSTHLNILAYLLGENYRSGLAVVPILLMANLFLGMYMNLSIWYKLVDKTIYGLYITIIGAILTVVLNILWIPIFGYIGSAYATLICYFVMTVVSYLSGQKYFTVPYSLKTIFSYISISLLLYIVSKSLNDYYVTNILLKQIIQSFVFVLFAVFALMQFKGAKM